MRALAGSMPVHPHSGIATVTVFTEGDVTFDDPVAGHGTIGYGGLEWARAGLGMWHGKELSAGSSPWCRASSCGSPFRLNWSAPNQKASTSAPSWCRELVRPASSSVRTKPRRARCGLHAGSTTCWSRSSQVNAGAINLLLVTLLAGSRLPRARSAAASGCRTANSGSSRPGEAPITLEGAEGTGATFVLGSAVPHPYELHLGAYSVHTTADALAAGERNLRELKKRLDARGDRRTASGSTPVFRG